jgi:allantoinase
LSAFDLVIRVGVGGDDVGVLDGVIAAVGPELEGGREEIDARGLYLLPGVVDAHVHLNEPGRTDWEGFATGTSALAAGGVTTAVDMPLNAHPPTVDGAGFDLKCACAERDSRIDFALWGGLVPGNLDRMEELAQRGVVGFKAFMADSGTDDFAAADDLTLYEGMRRAATLGLPVAVHAENREITSGLLARAAAQGRTTMRDWLASRPAVAETEAIARAIHLAQEAGCSLHVVHVSTGRGGGPRRRGPGSGRRRIVRDVPPLSPPDCRGRGAPGYRGQVRAAATRADRTRAPVERVGRRLAADDRLRPLTRPAGEKAR